MENHGTVREEMEEGKFVRQEDAFREWVSETGEYPAVADRYHLYVSLACPWASRTIIVRKWLELDRVIGMTVVTQSATNAAGPFATAPATKKIPSTASTS